MNREELPPNAPPEDIPPDHPRGLMARFRNYFLTGLVVAGPIAITFYLTWWFVNWVDNLVRPFVPTAYRPETYLPFGLPGSGLIVAVIALTLLGFLTANLIGRTLVDLGERLLGRIPAVRAIYRGLKQVFETLFSGSGSSFRRVGLVEFPVAGDVVDRADLATAERRDRQQAAGQRGAGLGIPALRAEPDYGILLLRAAQQGHRSRHERRRRRDPDHVGRRGAARLGSAEEGRGIGRHGERGEGGELGFAGACEGGIGDVLP